MFFFFSSRRRHTRCSRDWSSDVCSSDLTLARSLVVPLARAQLDEEPVRVAGMDPGDVLARPVVDADAVRLELLDAAEDVPALEADEVDALAVLLEEAPDRLGRVRRLQELDVADPRR